MALCPGELGRNTKEKRTKEGPVKLSLQSAQLNDQIGKFKGDYLSNVEHYHI